MTNVPDTSAKADASKAPVQTGEIITKDGYGYRLPDGVVIPLTFDDEKRWAQVQVLNSVHNYLAGKPFIENFFFQPPWGDGIPIHGTTRIEQDKEIEYLNKWYKRFPTKESFENSDVHLEAKPLGEAAIGITFSTGAKRDARALRYDLIPPCALKRLAKIYTEGAEHYGAHNWQKGMDYSDTINHALAHLLNWLSGDRSEDHLAKVAWAMFAIMYFEEYKVGNNDLEKPTNNP